MTVSNLLPLFCDDSPRWARPLIVAGPCSAESRSQVIDTALSLSQSGIKVFRAGVWKPRTKPGGFEGAGVPALEWLGEVKRVTGMLTATEIATAEHAREAIASGIDVVWLGARTSANPFAVQEIADMLSQLDEDRRDRLTVLVKNPVNPDIDLWLGALERIRLSGIRRLGAVHRGFSAYGRHLYRNPPQWRIPIELARRVPGLPILCDPSHIGGSRDLIAPLSQQALDMNFDGLIIETHCSPESALSDSAQQITPERLSSIIRHLEMPMRHHGESTESLDMLRRQIDAIDDELLELLARRMSVAGEIGVYKKEHGMPVVQPERYNDLMERRVASGCSLGLCEDFTRTVLAAIHEESVRRQIDVCKRSKCDEDFLSEDKHKKY